jgi:acyl-CoA oxidase
MKLPRVYEGLDREGLYLEGLRRAQAIMDDMVDHNHRHFSSLTERYQIANASPLGLNFSMFRKAIELQGTLEQRNYWLPLIDEVKVNGAYAQTEIGHGTFVRGIETTATFDPEFDGFKLNSPTITSTKYWPGGLGLSCSHAIVVARLIAGKPPADHGIHMFLVKIRSLDDYRPVDGVELGDQGMKMSYNGTCNGYARFNNLHIPRDSLLSAHVHVTRDGSFARHITDEKGLLEKSYSIMLYHRGLITRCVSFALAQSVTIAARYSVVREQGYGTFANETDTETAIIRYTSQHYRIITLVARAYAILFASKKFDRQYQTTIEENTDGSSSSASLPFTHALVSGLKAWSTSVASAGAEEARQMCGGHGYVALSGLPEILCAVSASLTFEGENYVLWQQVGRYLFKQLEKFTTGKKVDLEMEEFMNGIERYLHGNSPDMHFREVSEGELRDSSILLSIFVHRSRRLLITAYHQFKSISQDSKAGDAWNKTMMPILSAAHAFTEYLVLRHFKEYTETIHADEPSLELVLSRLCSLFALTTIMNPTLPFIATSFTEDGSITLPQLNQMRDHVNEILVVLLPDLILLTDAWDFTDASLCSALGCRDGNVYERLMSWTKQVPINHSANRSGGSLPSIWSGKEGIKEILNRERKAQAKL